MELNTKIYKVASTGKVWEWQTWVEDRGTHAVVCTLSGQQNGQKTPTEIPIWEGKNIGKANETTPYEQAVSQALSKMENKLRGEYRLELGEASQGELRGGKKPMLAQKFHPEGEEPNSKTLEQLKILHEVVDVQPKLDGLRCIFKVKHTTVEPRTRGGDAFPPIPHIKADVRQAYIDKNLSGEYEFDGELFTTEIDFGDISGTLRKHKKTPEHEERLKKIKLHIYDVMLNKGYEERFQLITDVFGTHDNPKYPNIIPIESYRIIATNENILIKMEEFLAAGAEGLMLRTLDTPYQNKRAWQLCKFKYFKEEEYELADILEDSRGGMAGMFLMKCEPYTDRDGKVKDTFKVGVKDLTHLQCQEMFENKHSYIGQQVTVRFQIYSKYGVPIFGKFKSVRWDK